MGRGVRAAKGSGTLAPDDPQTLYQRLSPAASADGTGGREMAECRA